MTTSLTPTISLFAGLATTLPEISPVTTAIDQQSAEMRNLNDCFVKEERPHALLITNHGYPGPDSRWPSSARDTGGQITYVNRFAECLVDQGFKVTVASRSFTPPESYAEYGSRRGVDFFVGNPLARYVYVPGITDSFVRKEELFAELPVIGANLAALMRDESAKVDKSPWDYVTWISSHYWDAGVVGQLLVRRWQEEILAEPSSEMMEREDLEKFLTSVNRHSWTSHSIGTLKAANMDALPPPQDANEEVRKLKERIQTLEYESMNFVVREQVERALVGGALVSPDKLLFPYAPPAPSLAYTSVEIRDHMQDLGAAEAALVRFPPGTDFNRYYPRSSVDDEDMQEFFKYLEGIVPEEVLTKMRTSPQDFTVIAEASRMDETKRKHILIEAMKYLPENTILLISGKNDKKKGVYSGLEALISELGLESRVFLLGMVPDELMGPLCSLPHGTNSDQFRLAIGAGASRMEGWGMSVMDMTAGGLPLISSNMTPYAVYIKEKSDAAIVIRIGESEPERYAAAMQDLIDDPKRARGLAARGREAAREFDWPELTRSFVSDLEGRFGL